MSRLLASVMVLALSGAASCGSPGSEATAGIGAARAALAEGSPKRALTLLGDAKDDAALVVRLRAMITLSQWGDVDRLLVGVPAGPDKDGLSCLFAAEREDVTAMRLCEAVATTSFDDPVMGDEVRSALAAVYEREHRPEAAEKTLRALVEARPTRPNRRALVDFFERQGFVREAVTAAEAWYDVDPHDPTLRARLGQLLERKTKGDLLDKRWAEAEAAARRLLELVPTRQVVRYHLADALENQGKKAEAEAERKRLRELGVEPPPTVDTFPGMPNNPTTGPHDHAHPPGAHTHP